MRLTDDSSAFLVLGRTLENERTWLGASVISLRLLAWIKRGAKALERIADTEEHLCRIEAKRFEFDFPAAREPKRAVISVSSTNDFNQGYLEQHPELRYERENAE
jgi:hypothetical protein